MVLLEQVSRLISIDSNKGSCPVTVLHPRHFPQALPVTRNFRKVFIVFFEGEAESASFRRLMMNLEGKEILSSEMMTSGSVSITEDS